MPTLLRVFNQPLRPLPHKQIEDQLPDGGILANILVHDDGIIGIRTRIRLVRETCNAIHDVVFQLIDTELISQSIQAEEGEVSGWLFRARFCAGTEVVDFRVVECALVEPLEEVGEGCGVVFGEGDGVGEAFSEAVAGVGGGAQAGVEEGGCGAEEAFVGVEGGGGGADEEEDYGGEDGELRSVSECVTMYRPIQIWAWSVENKLPGFGGGIWTSSDGIVGFHGGHCIHGLPHRSIERAEDKGKAWCWL